MRSLAAHVWLPVLMQLNPQAGVDILETGLKSARPSNAQGARWFATLFGRDRRETIDLRALVPPKSLLRLVRLAYKHVRRADDARHEGTYTPNERDAAQNAAAKLSSAHCSPQRGPRAGKPNSTWRQIHLSPTSRIAP